MMRTTPIPLLLAVALAGAADPPTPSPIPPRAVKLELPHATLRDALAAVTKQTGLPVSFPDAAGSQPLDAVFNGVPFWDALESLADQSGHRIALKDDGRRVELVSRGKSREVSAVSGAFRVVARQVVARSLLDEGTTAYDLHLDVHWEPRFPVFRIDAQPVVTKATDDRGTALTVRPGGSRTQPTGAVHAATVRLDGLTRAAKRVAVVEGYFTVAASEKVLTFRFADPAGKGPAPLPQEGVSAVLKRFTKEDGTWEAEVGLTYPPELPEFESFEAWAAGNRVRLVSPDGTKVFAPDSYTTAAAGPKVTGSYYFKENPAKGLTKPDAKGWAVVYEAPSPPRELRVPFTLKEVPLP